MAAQQHLSEPERQAAPILFASLIAGAQAYETLRLRFSSSNDKFTSDIRRTVVDAVYWHMKIPVRPRRRKTSRQRGQWYISLAAINEDLREIPFSTEWVPLSQVKEPLVLSMAVRTGTDVRLIDNITLPFSNWRTEHVRKQMCVIATSTKPLLNLAQTH